MDYRFLKKRIKKNEGFSYTVYKDQLGNPTIGYGHLIKPSENYLFLKKHNKNDLNRLFEEDFNKALISFNKHFNKPNIRSRKKSELIIEMIFQIGIKGVLNFKKMIKQIKNNNNHLAALEMMDSLWYLQTPRRVESLIKYFLYK